MATKRSLEEMLAVVVTDKRPRLQQELDFYNTVLVLHLHSCNLSSLVKEYMQENLLPDYLDDTDLMAYRYFTQWLTSESVFLKFMQNMGPQILTDYNVKKKANKCVLRGYYEQIKFAWRLLKDEAFDEMYRRLLEKKTFDANYRIFDENCRTPNFTCFEASQKKFVDFWREFLATHGPSMYAALRRDCYNTECDKNGNLSLIAQLPVCSAKHAWLCRHRKDLHHIGLCQLHTLCNAGHVVYASAWRK